MHAKGLTGLACSGDWLVMGKRRTKPSRTLKSAASWAALLASCTAVDTTAEYDDAAKAVQSATGVEQAYHPHREEELLQRQAQLLEHGLELREAVELGLLRNPFFQAAFRNVGIAEANRIQAGLLSNPSLSAALRFPLEGGGSAQIEGGLLTGISDLWQIPERSRVAQNALERTILELAHSSVQLASNIRTAYIEFLAAEQLLTIAQENRDSAVRLVDVVQARLEVGAATAIDHKLVELEFIDTEVAVRDARFVSGEQRRRLMTLLGYDHVPANMNLIAALPTSSGELPEIEILRGIASKQRLDIKAAHARLHESMTELHRQHGLVVKVVELGVSAERESDWALGPALSLELPIFDQNQAQIAKAVETLAQNQALLRAVKIAAAQDVSSAHARAQAEWDAARLFSKQVSRANETLDLAQLSYEAGKTTITSVIEAQRKLLKARRMHITRIGAMAAAISDLERATGAHREELFGVDSNLGKKSQ